MEIDKNLLKSLQDTLGFSDINIKSLDGGTNNRTYVIHHKSDQYILRYEMSEGFQLRRSYNAQSWADSSGVKVPKVVAHNFDSHENIFWIVEEKIDGEHFDLNSLDEKSAIKTSYDLGHQFKLIHSKVVDKFGLVPPYPYQSYRDWYEINPGEVKVSENLTGPVFDNFESYKAKLISRMEEALLIIKLDLKLVEDLRMIFNQFNYSGLPLFCGGDTRVSNIITKDGSIKAIIDWEWAYGGDPASHIAGWSSGNLDKYLDSFLKGYEPENFQQLKSQVLKYELLDAVTLINVYNDMGDKQAISNTAIKLIGLLREKAWEKV